MRTPKIERDLRLQSRERPAVFAGPHSPSFGGGPPDESAARPLAEVVPLRPVCVEALDPLIRANYKLIPLHRWNHVDDKGKERGKTPCDKHWVRDEYRPDVIPWAKDGGNVGVCLRDTDLVIDYDPRNAVGDPKAALERFQEEFGLRLDKCPRVNTGSGGAHFYLQMPSGLRIKNSLEKDYPGVLEFKSLGRQVVSPGSIHPNGRPYEWDDFTPSMDEGVPDAPAGLIEAIRKPDRPKGGARSEERLSKEHVINCVDQLIPEEYRDHDPWFELMQSVHFASGGDDEVRDFFIRWSTSDPQYADDDEVIQNRWESLNPNPDGPAVGVGTLYKHVIDAGGNPNPPASMVFSPIEEAGECVPGVDRARIKELSWSDLVAQEAPTYLVEDLLVDDGVTTVVGPPKSGKTYWTLDLALSMATGRQFHGRDVRRGRVTYVCSEGGAARFRQRIAAWCKHHGVDPNELDGSFGLVASPLKLLAEQDVDDLLAAIGGERRLVVFDTLARTMGGNENAQEDMNRYVAACDRVRVATGGTVVVVHHFGKDGRRGARGSNVLLAAVETEVTVEKNSQGHVVRVTEDRHGLPRAIGTYFFKEVNVDEEGPRPGVLVEGAREAPAAMHVPQLAREVAEREGPAYPMKLLINAVRKARGLEESAARNQVIEYVPEGPENADPIDRVWRDQKQKGKRGPWTVHVEPQD